MREGKDVRGCFFQKNCKRFDGETNEDWTPCETVRTERKPRQWVVASVAKFGEEDLSAGWKGLEALLDGQRPQPKQRGLFAAVNGDRQPARWALADLQSLGVERVRECGSVFLALAPCRRLRLHALLAGLIESGREEIGWADVAVVLTAVRFCGQASELGVSKNGAHAPRW